MLRDLPPLTAVRAFEAVGRHGSVSKAGAELNVSHAAVSQQVRALEEWLGGVRLTRRQGRSIVLTDVGEAYWRAVGEALGGLEMATASVRRLDSDRPVEITTTSSFLARWLMPRLAGFQLGYPDIRLSLRPSAELMDFSRETIDLAIRYGRGDWPGLLAEKLIGGRLSPVCAPALDARHPIRAPGDLKHHTLLHDSDTSEWETWLADHPTPGVVADSGIIHMGSAYAIEAAVQAQGVALGPVDMLREDFKAGRLVAPLEASVWEDCSYYVVRPANRPERPAARTFREWVKAEAAAAEGLFPDPDVPILEG